MIHQLKIDLDASLYARITEALGYSLAVGFISDFLADLREIVLAVGVLHMGQQLRAFAHQIHAAAKQVPARSHLGRIDIGHRQHTARKSTAILCASILSFLALPPWIAFMYSACPRTKGIFCLAHRSASQYQVKMAFHANRHVFSVGGYRFKEQLRGTRHVSV